MDQETATALDLWRTVARQTLSAPGPDLTARQTAILLTVHLDPGPHTVRGLSAQLSIAKPAVSRALDLLESNGLVLRTEDASDRRSVIVIPTEAGAARLESLAAGLAGALANATEGFRKSSNTGDGEDRAMA